MGGRRFVEATGRDRNGDGPPSLPGSDSFLLLTPRTVSRLPSRYIRSGHRGRPLLRWLRALHAGTALRMKGSQYLPVAQISEQTIGRPTAALRAATVLRRWEARTSSRSDC